MFQSVEEERVLASAESNDLSHMIYAILQPYIKAIIHNPTAPYLKTTEFLLCITCITLGYLLTYS